ncbi:MAG: PD40 domain-containing protein [Theionarchaea archaeon]|nr:MAG: hypothetical protein AYK19_01005 [Theionarchaea archaeon DG-70-1]MBU7029942.1 PD40 domain-containing protein [Theionarchaea archaeon]
MRRKIRIVTIGCMAVILTGVSQCADLAHSSSYQPWPLDETLETSHFIIHHKHGHEMFAQEVADIAEGIYENATSFMKCTPQEKVDIYMYPSDLLSTFAGETLEDYSGFVMYYACPFSTQALGLNYFDEKGIIAHELNHVLLNQRLPISIGVLREKHEWLVEGIATYYARYPSVARSGDDPMLPVIVQHLEETNDFPASLETITFRRYERLAYPLSYSVIKFIFDEYGEGKFHTFLDSLEEWDPLQLSTENVDRGLQEAFGKTRDEFESEWVSYVKGLPIPEQEFKAVQITYPPDRRMVSSWYDDKLLFTRYSEKSHDLDLYVMNPDGTNVQQLTVDSYSIFDPKFSPDGKKIAFTAIWLVYSGYYYDIYVMNADGKGAFQLTFSNTLDIMGSWSPDSKRIAFTSVRNGNYDIYVMDTNGSKVVQLTRHKGDDGWPAFSPDGQKIVFVSDRGGNYDLYVMNSDGTGVQQLTDTPEDENYPAYSPDGTRIAFLSRGERGGEICVMNSDGTERETITTSPNYVVDRNLMLNLFGCPVWSSDGTEIAFSAVDQIFTVSVPHVSAVPLPLQDFDFWWVLVPVVIAIVCALLWKFLRKK